MDDIASVGDLVDALKTLASDNDECLNSGVADGVRQAIRLIDDLLSRDQRIVSAGEEESAVKDDSARIKILMNQIGSLQAEVEQNKLDANNVAVDSYDFREIEAEVARLQWGLQTNHQCKQCRGVGKYRPFMVDWECELCGGVGVSLDDPLGAIKGFKEITSRSVMIASNLSKHVYEMTYSQSQRIEHGAERFYASIGKADC